MRKKDKPTLFNKEYQKEWSKEYRYKHIHTGEHCTFESYVAEYLVLRWTDSFKMDKPSYKFWTVGDKYHDVFMRNMKAATQLKKKFDEAIIIAAIRSDYFENIYHIGIKGYGHTGWKYNQVAIEAIKCYDKVQKNFLKKQKLTEEAEVANPKSESKKLQKRNKQYSNKKSSLNRLRKQ